MQHVVLHRSCPPSLPPSHPSTPHCSLSAVLQLCSRWYFVSVCHVFHFVSVLVSHCVSVSGVTSVVLPYGRWHHAVLPQGRTTDGMLGGVCVRQSVPPSVSSFSTRCALKRVNLGSTWFCGWWRAFTLSNMHPSSPCSCWFYFVHHFDVAFSVIKFMFFVFYAKF